MKKSKFPKATHDGVLRIGEIEIPCAVLEDGTRVISQRGFAKGLGGAKPTSLSRRGAGNLPPFLAAKNLNSFISQDLAAAAIPIPYLPQRGGRSALGLRADALPRICNVYLAARDAGVLRKNQEHLGKQADILMRGLAHIGIIALVDEATGYQYHRAREALAKILEKFISQQLCKWAKTFPDQYYQELFRLRGWHYRSFSTKRPILAGRLTNNIVYERLAPGVLRELRTKNPVMPQGWRKHKHHQWLTSDYGHPRLREHLSAVIALMKASRSWSDFKRNLERALPKHLPMPLFGQPD